MGTSSNAAQFAHKINAAGKAIEKARKVELDKLAAKMERSFNKAVAADLGSDRIFTGGPRRGSGWKKATFVSKSTVKVDGIKFEPERMSLGPMRVAQQGRNQTMRVLADGASGPVFGQGGISKKTGKALRGKKRTKWNGKTAGKNTWTDTTDDIVKYIPKQLRPGFIKAAGEVFK